MKKNELKKHTLLKECDIHYFFHLLNILIPYSSLILPHCKILNAYSLNYLEEYSIFTAINSILYQLDDIKPYYYKITFQDCISLLKELKENTQNHFNLYLEWKLNKNYEKE